MSSYGLYMVQPPLQVHLYRWINPLKFVFLLLDYYFWRSDNSETCLFGKIFFQVHKFDLVLESVCNNLAGRPVCLERSCNTVFQAGFAIAIIMLSQTNHARSEANTLDRYSLHTFTKYRMQWMRHTGTDICWVAVHQEWMARTDMRRISVPVCHASCSLFLLPDMISSRPPSCCKIIWYDDNWPRTCRLTILQGRALTHTRISTLVAQNNVIMAFSLLTGLSHCCPCVYLPIHAAVHPFKGD